MPRWHRTRATSEVVTQTDAVEEGAVIVTITCVASAFEEELVLDHRSDEGLVLDPVLDAEFRTAHEGLVHTLAIKATQAQTDKGPGVAGAEVIVVEQAGRAASLPLLKRNWYSTIAVTKVLSCTQCLMPSSGPPMKVSSTSSP